MSGLTRLSPVNVWADLVWAVPGPDQVRPVRNSYRKAEKAKKAKKNHQKHWFLQGFIVIFLAFSSFFGRKKQKNLKKNTKNVGFYKVLVFFFWLFWGFSAFR